MLQRLFYKDGLTLLLCISLAILAPLNVNAQQWAPIGAEWTYGLAWPFSPEYSFEIWKSEKDTLIQNKLCSKIINIRGDSSNNWWKPNNPIYSYEDSGKIFLHNSQRDTFTLLYNFNGQIGDEWYIFIDSCTYKYELISTNMDTIDGLEVKIITMQTLYGNNYPITFKIAEGIGNTNKMLPIYNHDHSECYLASKSYPFSVGLRCYADPIQGQIVFNENVDCKYSNVSINELNLGLEFKVYPNPSNGIFTIDFKHQQVNQIKISIIDIMGKTVYSFKAETNNAQIDLSHLSKGVYFLRLTENSTGEMIRTTRFIIGH